MLIRSQDKDHLVSLDINDLKIFDGETKEKTSYISAISRYDHHKLLGHYKTHARASEVLDEICKAYIGCRPCGGQIEINVVYQMPER